MMSVGAARLASCYKLGCYRHVGMRFGTLRIGIQHLQTSAPLCMKLDSEEESVRFSKTKAATWKISDTGIPPREVPPYQPIIISISVIVFLVYFLILREESDIDMEFRGSLFDRVPGLEEQQLKLAIDYNRKQGKDVTELEKRLNEIVGTK